MQATSRRDAVERTSSLEPSHDAVNRIHPPPTQVTRLISIRLIGESQREVARVTRVRAESGRRRRRSSNGRPRVPREGGLSVAREVTIRVPVPAP